MREVTPMLTEQQALTVAALRPTFDMENALAELTGKSMTQEEKNRLGKLKMIP